MMFEKHANWPEGTIDWAIAYAEPYEPDGVVGFGAGVEVCVGAGVGVDDVALGSGWRCWSRFAACAAAARSAAPCRRCLVGCGLVGAAFAAASAAALSAAALAAASAAALSAAAFSAAAFAAASAAALSAEAFCSAANCAAATCLLWVETSFAWTAYALPAPARTRVPAAATAAIREVLVGSLAVMNETVLLAATCAAPAIPDFGSCEVGLCSGLCSVPLCEGSGSFRNGPVLDKSCLSQCLTPFRQPFPHSTDSFAVCGRKRPAPSWSGAWANG